MQLRSSQKPPKNENKKSQNPIGTKTQQTMNQTRKTQSKLKKMKRKTQNAGQIMKQTSEKIVKKKTKKQKNSKTIFTASTQRAKQRNRRITHGEVRFSLTEEAENAERVRTRNPNQRENGGVRENGNVNLLSSLSYKSAVCVSVSDESVTHCTEGK